MATTKKTDHIIHWGKDVEELEFLHTAEGNIERNGHSGKQLAI